MTKMQTATPKGAALDPSTHSADAVSVAAVSGNKDTSNDGAVAEIKAKELTPRERSNLNLRMFKPGQSGNLSGRPKGIVAKVMTKELQRKIAGSNETVLKAYIRKYIEEAIRECDAARFTSIRDTTDGKPSANDSDRISVGTVNVMFAGGLPDWLQPPAEPESVIDITPSATLAERVASKSNNSVNGGDGDKGNQRQDTPAAKKSNGGS